MGVYIKGMEMPIDYGRCMVIFPDGRVTTEFGSQVIAKAVPVPPHGRLVDADLIMKKLKESCRIAFGDDGDIPECSALSIVADYIEPAPTVIPAEREGET